jgi:hypothetical protein
MAFQQDLVFLPGLDRSYDSHKRALVRRQIAGGRRKKSRRSSSNQGWVVESGLQDGLKEPDQPDAWQTAPPLRYNETVSDRTTRFDPFSSTAGDPNLPEQNLCRHCKCQPDTCNGSADVK